jgi:hypothetical protein
MSSIQTTKRNSTANVKEMITSGRPAFLILFQRKLNKIGVCKEAINFDGGPVESHFVPR